MRRVCCSHFERSPVAPLAGSGTTQRVENLFICKRAEVLMLCWPSLVFEACVKVAVCMFLPYFSSVFLVMALSSPSRYLLCRLLLFSSNFYHLASVLSSAG
mmetsp:Transcript_50633/g.107395  ORF Transcript_50633/g.107395 Transcript_50633/m.107395 type:complete len:101 (-) Transcript_50633:202-504(-)